MDKIQKIIEELRLYCGMDENGQLIINKLLEALSDSKDTEPCNLRKCKHYNAFFDDNCGGSNMENCIILEEQSKDTSTLDALDKLTDDFDMIGKTEGKIFISIGGKTYSADNIRELIDKTTKERE